MRVWLYYRLSNDDDKEQNSLLNQRKITLEYALLNGYIVAGESSDDNASGMNFQREGIREIVKAVVAGSIDAVIVKDLSRLGRHKIQTALLIDFLRENSVRVLSVTESVDTFDENDDLTIGIRGLMNDYYARDIGRKIRTGYRQKQKAGIVIIAPFGYWKNKNTKQVEIVDEAADTVRLIFSLYLSGVGLRPISQLLNQQRRKTPAQLQAELYGKHNPDIHTDKDGQHIYLWNYTGVKRILIDESYAGTLRNHKAEMHNGKVTLFIPKEEQFRHEDFLPAIVSKKEWLTAQTELVSRNGKRVPRENNIAAHRYAGLLKCGDCGAPFVPIIRKTDKKQRIEYICKYYQLRGRSFCESHRIHEEKLDAEVRSAIETLLLSLRIEMADIQKELKIRASSKPILDTRASLLRAEIQSLDSDIDAALMERINDKPNTNRYTALITKLTADHEKARQELVHLETHDANLRRKLRALTKQASSLDEVLKNTPITEIDLRRLTDYIEVKHDRKTIDIQVKLKDTL